MKEAHKYIQISPKGHAGIRREMTTSYFKSNVVILKWKCLVKAMNLKHEGSQIKEILTSKLLETLRRNNNRS